MSLEMEEDKFLSEKYVGDEVLCMFSSQTLKVYGIDFFLENSTHRPMATKKKKQNKTKQEKQNYISMKDLTKISRQLLLDVWWPVTGIHRSSVPTNVGVGIERKTKLFYGRTYLPSRVGHQNLFWIYCIHKAVQQRSLGSHGAPTLEMNKIKLATSKSHGRKPEFMQK